jgi:hypothetical protein
MASNQPLLSDASLNGTPGDSHSDDGGHVHGHDVAAAGLLASPSFSNLSPSPTSSLSPSTSLKVTIDTPQPLRASNAAASGGEAGSRLVSLDLLRGLIMIIMAWDHVKDFLNDQQLPKNEGWEIW